MNKIFKRTLFENGDYSENENIKFNAILIGKKLINNIIKSIMDLNNNSINKERQKSNIQLIDLVNESDLNNNNNFINNLSNKSNNYFTRSIERKFNKSIASSNYDKNDHSSGLNTLSSNRDDELIKFNFIDHDQSSNYEIDKQQIKVFNSDQLDEEIRAEIKESALIKNIDRILASILNPDFTHYQFDENLFEENDQKKLNNKRALSFDESFDQDINDDDQNNELIDNQSTIFKDNKIEVKSDSKYRLRKRQKLDIDKCKKLNIRKTKDKSNVKVTKDKLIINELDKFDEEIIDEETIDESESGLEDLSILYSKLNYTTLEDDLVLTDDSDIETSIKSDSKINLINDNTTLKDIYKVEKILAKRYRKSGKLEYLVKYTNLDDDQLFWEHEKTIDNKLKDEFNQKYGDKLLLKEISKESRSIFLDTCVDKEILSDEYKDTNYDLKELINKSIDKPLCDIYNNIKPERIYGIFEYENKFYYLIKWKLLDKADVFECSKFKERFPQIVYDYYESRIVFNQLVKRKESAPLKHDKRIFLEHK